MIDVAAGADADGELLGWSFTNINAGTAGIATPHRVADLRIEYTPADSPLLQGSYRGLAATANNFARESIIDELAWRLGLDPVTFRLRNLADDRLAAVLRAVAEHIGWPPGNDRDEDDAGAPAVGPSAGAGETPMIAVAPAVASAIFAATGRRLCSLPLTL